jgi:hypothetical protein
MDHSDLESQTGNYLKDLVAKPFLFGLGFGLGYCLATVLIQHPWNADLLKHVKELLHVKNLQERMGDIVANPAVVLQVEEAIMHH